MENSRQGLADNHVRALVPLKKLSTLRNSNLGTLETRDTTVSNLKPQMISDEKSHGLLHFTMQESSRVQILTVHNKPKTKKNFFVEKLDTILEELTTPFTPNDFFDETS